MSIPWTGAGPSQAPSSTASSEQRVSIPWTGAGPSQAPSSTASSEQRVSIPWTGAGPSQAPSSAASSEQRVSIPWTGAGPSQAPSSAASSEQRVSIPWTGAGPSQASSSAASSEQRVSIPWTGAGPNPAQGDDRKPVPWSLIGPAIQHDEMAISLEREEDEGEERVEAGDWCHGDEAVPGVVCVKASYISSARVEAASALPAREELTSRTTGDVHHGVSKSGYDFFERCGESVAPALAIALPAAARHGSTPTALSTSRGSLSDGTSDECESVCSSGSGRGSSSEAASPMLLAASSAGVAAAISSLGQAGGIGRVRPRPELEGAGGVDQQNAGVEAKRRRRRTE